MRKNTFFKIIAVVFLLSGVGLNAQTIKGKVVDSSGEALAFINVQEKKSTNGTTT